MNREKRFEHLITNYEGEKKGCLLYIDEMEEGPIKQSYINGLKELDVKVENDSLKILSIIDQLRIFKYKHMDYYTERKTFHLFIVTLLSIMAILITSLNDIIRPKSNMLFYAISLLITLLNGKLVSEYANRLDDKYINVKDDLKSLKKEYEVYMKRLDDYYFLLECNNHKILENKLKEKRKIKSK